MAILNQPPLVTDSNTTKSLAFPFQRGKSGFPASSDPDKVVFYHLVNLILTGKNERVMNPDIGVNIHSYIFDNLTPITMARISSIVSSSIDRWVPEARIIRIVPTIDKNEDGTQSSIKLDIVYRVANQTEQMQIPINVGVKQG